MSAESSSKLFLFRKLSAGAIALGLTGIVGGGLGVPDQIVSAIDHEIGAKVDSQLEARGITLIPNKETHINHDDSLSKNDGILVLAGFSAAMLGAVALGGVQGAIEIRNSNDGLSTTT